MKQLHDALVEIQNPGRETSAPTPTQPQTGNAPRAAGQEDGDPEAAVIVLIAEDSPTNMLLARGLLGKVLPNAELLQAENGKTAVELFAEHDPDIVLMDVQMPEMDGYDATEAIRRMERKNTGSQPARRTPIIALTAGALAGDREKALEAGMDDYLAKPVTIQSLQALILKWMDGDGALEGPDREHTDQRVADDLFAKIAANLRRHGHDGETIGRMVDMLTERIPELIAALSTSIENEDAVALRAAAHSAKGILNTLGMDEEAENALAAEKAAVEKKVDRAADYARLLARDLARLSRLSEPQEGRGRPEDGHG